SLWQSAAPFSSGVFHTALSCPSGNTSGLLVSFGLSNTGSTGPAAGVTFDMVGSNKQMLLATLHRSGKAFPTQVSLPSPCDSVPARLSLYWDAHYVSWYVNRQLVRYLPRSSSPLRFPAVPLILFGTIKAAALTNLGAWAGKMSGNPLPKTAMWTGSRFRSPQPFAFGFFSVDFKCPSGLTSVAPALP
ncbi:unnamed protein product, partial [Closterium sp. NIES-53]